MGTHPMTVSLVCIVISIVLFLLATFGVTLGSVALVPLGLALFAAGHVL